MLDLRLGFISSHLTADKLFPVNLRAIMGPPKTCLLLVAKSMPSLIIKPRLIIVTQTDNLSFLYQLSCILLQLWVIRPATAVFISCWCMLLQ